MSSPNQKFIEKPSLKKSWIESDAIDVVDRLQRSKFTTYLVGGCVRDLLVGIPPKDYDIVTNAEPQVIRKKIPYAFVIGRRFKLVLVKRGDTQYEVATFRRAMTAEEETASETPTEDNTYGSPEEDAIRRDFTINALFYDPIKDELIDFINGMDDIKNRILRVIGDPLTRLNEDPIRILRAIRLSHKLDFSIEHELRLKIKEAAEGLKTSALPRKREEFIKILKLDRPDLVFFELWDLGLIHATLPTLAELLETLEDPGLFFELLRDTKIWAHGSTKTEDLYLKFFSSLFDLFPDLLSTQQDKFENLLRNELGIFKLEQSQIMARFEFIDELTKCEAFEKRGRRRQENFLKHELLKPALHLARLGHYLPPEVLAFWWAKLQAPPIDGQ